MANIIQVVCDEGVVFEGGLSWESFVEALRVVDQHTDMGHVVDHLYIGAAENAPAVTAVADAALAAVSYLPLVGF